jgi:hypothetical protein
MLDTMASPAPAARPSAGRNGARRGVRTREHARWVAGPRPAVGGARGGAARDRSDQPYRWRTGPLARLLAGLMAALGTQAARAQLPAAAGGPMRPSLDAPALAFTVREDPQEVTIATARYTLGVRRQGYALTVRRAGAVVLEGARPDDAASDLGFRIGGVAHRLTRLEAVDTTGGAVALAYATSAPSVSARVTFRPHRDGARVTAQLLGGDAAPVPTLRVRLAPSGAWYGGGHQGFRAVHALPLNGARVRQDAFHGFSQSQAAPIWYATAGVGLWVDLPFELRHAINAPGPDGAPDGLLAVEVPQASALSYQLLVGDDVRAVVRTVLRAVGRPRVTPPAEFFRQPIYTTWVEYKADVDQAKVLAFARAIRRHALPAGVLEIDDRWESAYGDLTFDAARFPDPRAMVDTLHRLGFRVTLWVHPFVNLGSRTYAEQRDSALLVRARSTGGPALLRWWNGVAALWDVSNPDAVRALRARLDRLQRAYGFDGFKFDGGDAKFVAQDAITRGGIGPVEYADVYNRDVAARYAWNETRVGVYSQPTGVVQRLMDKQSTWGPANGLGAVVPEALLAAVRGWPYQMPDMVGGNEYDDDRISAELLVRWAQASAPMPFLQFSRGPWHFGDEAVRLARAASALHLRLAPYTRRLADASRATGEPVLAPLWYHAPADTATFGIVDQYMVGGDLVVAPVLRAGATARDVYLPGGRWRDLAAGRVVDGGRWLRAHPAPLATLPLFARAGSEADALLGPGGRAAEAARP